MKAFKLLAVVLLLVALGACGGEVEEDRPELNDDPVIWRSPVVVATGDAERGPWRMNESEFHYVDDPAVAAGQDGETLFVWVDNRAQTIYFQRFDAEGEALLGEPVAVLDSPDVFSWLPRIVTSDGGNTILVAWEEILFTGGSHGGEILVARSEDGGQSFAEPVNVSWTTGGAGKGRQSESRWDNGSLDLVVDGDRVWVAWTEFDGDLRLARSMDGGSRFQDAIHISGSGDQPTRAPALALLDDGRIVLAWTYGEQDTADVQLAVSNDDGESFELMGPALERAGYADAPRLAVDGQGNLHLVFAEAAQNPGEGAGLVHARAGADLDFGAGQLILEPSGTGQAYAGFPQLLSDGSDLVVTWEILDRQTRLSLGLGLLHSGDGGDSFSRPLLVPGTGTPEGGFGGGLQGLLMRKADMGPGGRLVVGHSHFIPDTRSEVLLIRGRIDD